jgi:hypothetical protein
VRAGRGGSTPDGEYGLIRNSASLVSKPEFGGVEEKTLLK